MPRSCRASSVTPLSQPAPRRSQRLVSRHDKDCGHASVAINGPSDIVNKNVADANLDSELSGTLLTCVGILTNFQLCYRPHRKLYVLSGQMQYTS
jgi:hypothetical protein